MGGSCRQEPVRPGNTSLREGSSRGPCSDPWPGPHQPMVHARHHHTHSGHRGADGQEPALWAEGFLCVGGTEGGASSLHRLLLWRPARERLPREVRATGTTGALLSTWEAQALHRPWRRGGTPRQQWESHSNEPAVAVGSLPSELPPRRSLKPQPLSWWRFGGAGRRAVRPEQARQDAGPALVSSTLVSSTRHSPRTPSLKGAEGGGSLPGDAAAGTGHGDRRQKPQNRTILRGSDVWWSRFHAAPLPPVNANGCSWAAASGGSRHEPLGVGPPAFLAVPMHAQERSARPSLEGLPGQLCSRPAPGIWVSGCAASPCPRRVRGQAVLGERKTKNPRAVRSAV